MDFHSDDHYVERKPPRTVVDRNALDAARAASCMTLPALGPSVLNHSIIDVGGHRVMMARNKGAPEGEEERTFVDEEYC